MNKKMNNLIIGLIVCTLSIPTSLIASGNNSNPSENGTIINERYIEVPNSSVILKFWNQKSITGMSTPFYSISLDGGNSFVRTVQPSYDIGLRYACFDPLNGEPSILPILASSDDTHLFIVQFVTQPLQEFSDAISACGGSVRHYIAQYAYLVEMNQSARSQVESLPYVRWIGPYHPAYRIEEYLLENIENANQVYPLERYNIQVMTAEQKTIVADRIKIFGGMVNKADAGKFLVEATLSPDQLFSVIRWDEVLFVDRWSPYEADMDIAREIGGANYVETVAGYNGGGVRGEVFDQGFNLQHVDFQSRPLIPHGTVGTDSHGASTSGIIFGDGTGNPKGRGMLPAGQGIVGDLTYIGLEGMNRYIHTGELLQDPYYGVFESASVGNDRTTQYTTISADTDAALFDFDVLHCQSQSNAGDQMSRPQAWAKNIVSCGGIYHMDTLPKTDDQWNYGASIGPASDGRIKPDLSHFYDWIFTTTLGSPTAYTDNFGGTSGATPIIAGHFGLFYQMWSDGIFGNEVNPDGTVFENRPHMTTAKAFLINTADQYPFNGTSEDKTRMHQGWGMPSVKNLYDLRDNYYIINEEDVLQPFGTSTHIVTVEQDAPYLKATMTYADPAGNPAVQSQHRINDLSLKVVSPSNVVYWGNFGLRDGVWSQPDGNPDTKDTVENVFIQNPEPGKWTIEISADEIIQDSHVETPEMDADYALVVSPVSLAPSIPQVSGGSQGDVGRRIDFTFTSTDPKNSQVYYWIEWGDGSHEEWFGPCESGVDATVSHSWDTVGNFTILAKAKNSDGAESEWSAPTVISIVAAQLELGPIQGGLFKVKTSVINKGAIEITQIHWNITLTGGAFKGKASNGVLSTIPGDGQQKISSDFIIGFGKTTITVTASYTNSTASKSQNATIFLFFIKV